MQYTQRDNHDIGYVEARIVGWDCFEGKIRAIEPQRHAQMMRLWEGLSDRGVEAMEVFLSRLIMAETDQELDDISWPYQRLVCYDYIVTPEGYRREPRTLEERNCTRYHIWAISTTCCWWERYINQARYGMNYVP